MKIAVCDRAAETSKDIERVLAKIAGAGKIKVYMNPAVLAAALREGRTYDVVFMEIDWGQEKTGVDFWNELQEYSPGTSVIYMGESIQPYIEKIFMYTCQLAGVLTKPIKLDYLQQCLEKIYRQKEKMSEKLMIRWNRRYILLPMQDVMYLESQLHKVSIVLEDRTYQCNDRLSALECYLDKRFVKCHKSYFVNMDYILEFSGNEITLRNRNKIPVSKSRYTAAKDRLEEYLKKM